VVTRGSLVERISGTGGRAGNGEEGYLRRCTSEAIDSYPPENALCVVLTGPRKRNLSSQQRVAPNVISLYSAVDVLYEGKVYYDCELSVFREVKKNDRRNL